MTRLPSIPPSNQRNSTVDSLRELAQIWKGEIGNKLDKVVLYRDLVSLDLGKINRNGSLSSGSITTPNPTYASIPVNLTAHGGLGVILLDWNIGNGAYAYTEIFRHTEDNLANATLIGRSFASLYADKHVSSGQSYYYWVRAVSTTGNETQFNATNGVLATAAIEPDYIIEKIQGLISESELAAELLTPIQSIPGIQTTLNDHGIRLPTVEDYVDILNTDVPALQTSVADFANRIPLLEADSSAHDLHLTSLDSRVDEIRNIPTFDTNRAYAIDDLVRYGGVTWKALVALASPSPIPSEGANWTNIGSYDTYDAVLAGDAQAISNLDSKITVAEASITSHSSDISSLQSSVTNANNNITGNANAINALDSRVTTTETTVASQSSAITAIEASLNDIVVSEFDANHSYVVDDVFKHNNEFYKVIAVQTPPNATPPNATYYEVSPDHASLQSEVTANASAIGALDTRVTSAEGTISSHGTSITALQAGLTNAETNIAANASANSSLDTRVTTAESEIDANTSAVTALNIAVTANDDDIAATNLAVSTLTGRVTANEGDISSVNSSITALNTSVSAAESDIAGNSAAISDLNTTTTTQAGQISSINNDITLLQSDVTSLENADSVNSTAIANLTTRVTAAEGEIDSNNSDLVSLNTSVSGLNDGVNANNSAIGLLTTRVTASEGDITSLNSDVTQLQSDVALLDVDGNAAAINSLTTRVTANENDISAVSGSVTTLSSSVSANTSAIESKAETSVVTNLNGEVTDIKAQHTLKLDVNGNIAGIGLMTDSVSSQMIVNSDSVLFLDQGQSATPFQPGYNYTSLNSLRNTQLVFGYATVQGQKRFVVNVPAYIPDGTITSAQIENATITHSQIVDLLVGSAEIAEGAISSAHIGNYIQSTGYQLGLDGWHINKNGSAIFNDVTIYDGSGNIAFQSGVTRIGDLDAISMRSLTSNPEMKMQSVDGKPVGYVTSVYVNRAIDWVDSNKDAVKVYRTSGSTAYVGLITTAFSVTPGAKYRLRFRAKTASGMGTSNLHAFIYFTNSDMPQGKRFIGSSSSGNTGERIAGDTYAWPGVVSANETYQDFEVEWTIEEYQNFKFASFNLHGDADEFHFDLVEVTEVKGNLSYKDVIDDSTYIANGTIKTLNLLNNTVTTVQRSERATDSPNVPEGTWGTVVTISIPSALVALNEVMPFLVFPFGLVDCCYGAQADAQFRICSQINSNPITDIYRGYLHVNQEVGGFKYVQLMDRDIEYVETNGNYGTGWADYGGAPTAYGYSAFQMNLSNTPPFTIDIPAGTTTLYLQTKSSSQYGATYQNIPKKGAGMAVIGMQR